MTPNESTLHPFLCATSVIDWDNSAVRQQSAALRRDNPIETARSCFEFVRDQIKHSRDYELDPSTWRASDALKHQTGYCYAKSHLLAALLRANGLPAAFCYQRLSINDAGPPYSLHGFNAVYLPDTGWYRIDARGNKPGVNARFDPPHEHLAFPLQSSDEFEFDNLWPDPLEVVLDALRKSVGWRDTLNNLPDVQPAEFEKLGFIVRANGRRKTTI
jgi:transglutaminase-like putative cysteine protease